jgi:FKBP-type peptidyl-prolyl cis-trans isomerase FkpA
MKALILFFLFSSIISFTACEKDYRAEDEALIQQYIADNNLIAIAAQDGLYYTIDVIGTGAQPSGVYSTVTAHYTGKFLDNTVFQSSFGGNPFTSELSDLILGWQYGFPYFNAGGTGKLLIPSHLAYGTSGRGNIPPNTPLVFDIELISVQN